MEYGPAEYRCPKCGSVVSVERVGKLFKGFCVVCGKQVWFCPVCGYASFSYRGVAGHLKTHFKTHRPDQQEIINVAVRLSKLINLDDQLIIKVLKEVASSSIDNQPDNQLIINLVTLACAAVALRELGNIREEVGRLKTRIDSLENLLKRAPPPRHVLEKAEPPPELGGDLPSFVEGNPWVTVISRRGSRWGIWPTPSQ